MSMVTEAQARINEEIAKQTLSLHNLCTRRNTFSPVSHLLVETLATILTSCARAYHCKDHDGSLSAVPCWVNVSYVCRHWRNVALNCPTLWTYVFLTSPWWTEELMAASQRASLKVSRLGDGTRHWLRLAYGYQWRRAQCACGRDHARWSASSMLCEKQRT